jgi:hypothetical protein
MPVVFENSLIHSSFYGSNRILASMPVLRHSAFICDFSNGFLFFELDLNKIALSQMQLVGSVDILFDSKQFI